MLEINHLNFAREGRTLLAIDKLNLDPKGFTLVLGHNGSGKSTLLKLLARQELPSSGSIRLNGQSLESLSQRQLAQQIAYLPQQLPDAPGLTVTELVRLGRFPWRGLFGRYGQQDKQLVSEAIAQTGLTEFAQCSVDQLSGGERQRAWIAMLLAQQAPLLMLDEPTAALDLAHQYQLLELLQRLHQERGCGVIVILHDLNLALRFAKQILALKSGAVAFQGTQQQFANPETLSELFGVAIELIPHGSGKVATVCEH